VVEAARNVLDGEYRQIESGHMPLHGGNQAMRSNQMTHYKQSELLALLYTKASILEIAHSLY